MTGESFIERIEAIIDDEVYASFNIDKAITSIERVVADYRTEESTE